MIYPIHRFKGNIVSSNIATGIINKLVVVSHIPSYCEAIWFYAGAFSKPNGAFVQQGCFLSVVKRKHSFKRVIFAVKLGRIPSCPDCTG